MSRYQPPSTADEPVRRLQGDSGVSAMFVAITFVVLIIVAALVTDLGLAYAGGRSMQNAADSAAMRGTRALLKYKQNPTTANFLNIYNESDAGVKQSGGTSMFQCEIIQNNAARSYIGPCGWKPAADSPLAGGVRLRSVGTTPTMFGKVLNYNQVTETRLAAATVQPVRLGRGPFYVCGGGQENWNVNNPPPATNPVPIPNSWNLNVDGTGKANGDDLPALLRIDGVPMNPPTLANGLVMGKASDGDPVTTMAQMMAMYPASRFSVNPGAVGAVYRIFTSSSNLEFGDCANHSASWKGKATDADQNLPGILAGDTGTKAGPTRTDVAGQPGCGLNLENNIGCVLVLPLCPGSNGGNGSHFEVYCTSFGSFQIVGTSNSANDVSARFLGAATITWGQGGLGQPDPNAANIVKLVQ